MGELAAIEPVALIRLELNCAGVVRTLLPVPPPFFDWTRFSVCSLAEAAMSDTNCWAARAIILLLRRRTAKVKWGRGKRENIHERVGTLEACATQKTVHRLVWDLARITNK